jgi:uncharacterized protein
MKRVLVDAGPLVAILSSDDDYHELCLNELHRMPRPLVSCWPVITEVAWLLRRSPRAVQRLLGNIDGSFLALLPLGGAEAAPIAGLMKKYEDLRPQLADAALVYLAGRERIRTIFSLDQRDFSVYRGDRRHAFEIVPRF